MPEQNKPFVVTDRRKFTLEGDPRPDADPSPEKEKRQPAPPEPESSVGPVRNVEPKAEHKFESKSEPAARTSQVPSSTHEAPESDHLPAPTAEQTEQSRLAYEMTAD